METKVPAQIWSKVEEKAVELAYRVIDIFEGVGIFLHRDVCHSR